MINFKFTFYVVARNRSIEPFFCSLDGRLNNDCSDLGFYDFLEESLFILDNELVKKYGLDEEFDVFIHIGDICFPLRITSSCYCIDFNSNHISSLVRVDVGTP